MAILTSANDAVLKKRFPLTKEPAVIGRHPDCEVHIDDASVSRRHAKVIFENGSYFVEDMESRNGTFLNNQQIHQRTKLYDDSEIRICDVTFVFQSNDQAGDAVRSRPTLEHGSNAGRAISSVFLDDDFNEEKSKIMSRLDVPSHHSRTHSHISAEEKLIALTKITHALSESIDRDQVLAKILDFLFDLFVEADRGFVILRNAEGRLQPLGFKTRRPRDDEQIRVSRTIVNQVMDTKQPIISSDAAADDRFDMAQSIVDFRIRSIMCAPLINSKDESIGVIQLDTLKQSIAFKEEDLETLVTVAMQASLAIQKSDLFEDVKKSNGLRTDLALAHELQQRFLPQHSPAVDHYEFFSFYRPMQQVGGDYFDYVPLEGNRIGIIAADVVGHGIAAALLMAKVSAESRFALATSKTAVEAVEKMNNGLSGLNIDRFVTLALGLLNTDTNVMTIVNAGHMPPIIRRASGEIEQLAIEEAGLPLGILQDFAYESIDVLIGPGDVVIMYTDGINEAMDADGNQLTTDALIEDIRASQTKTPETIGELICQTVARHSANTPAIDDMCLICIGRTH